MVCEKKIGTKIRQEIKNMQKTFFKLWGVPIILAIISLYALISALIGGIVVDAVACLLLCVPLFLVVRNYYIK